MWKLLSSIDEATAKTLNFRPMLVTIFVKLTCRIQIANIFILFVYTFLLFFLDINLRLRDNFVVKMVQLHSRQLANGMK